MENKLNELEAKKAELEKAFEGKKKQAQALANDIVLMEQLLLTKREHSKTLNEMNEIAQLHSTVCAEIDAEKAQAAKVVEEVKDEAEMKE